MADSGDVDLVDVREAAALARRTPETVRRWVWSGRLAAQRQGNRLLVRRIDVEGLVGGAEAAGMRRTETTLAAWAGEVAQTLKAGQPGTSAAELVLADRAGRSG